MTYTFPHSFAKLFLSPDEPLPSGRIYAEIGYQIGIIMSILYIMLWITSFSFIRKKMGGARWKKLHKCSYVLYGLVFVHSILLNTGWILGGRTPVAAYDRTPEWLAGIATMVVLYACYIALKIRKSRGVKKEGTLF